MSLHLVRAVVASLVAAVVVMIGAAGSATAHPGDDPVAVQQTPSSPLLPAGRDLLKKVRLAGLWEGPSGRMSLEKSSNPLVKAAGQHLIDGHAELDRRTLELGAKFDVDLPQEPNSDQKGWLAELTAAPAGSVEFDRIFANRLRAAHGVVYKFLAQMRTSTRNTEIRAYADLCMDTVLDHMTVLENTGLVDFSDVKAFPLPALAAPAAAKAALPPPAPVAQSQDQPSTAPSDSTVLIVLIAVVLAALLVSPFMRSGSGRGRP
jgi:predicted outer membrane protein